MQRTSHLDHLLDGSGSQAPPDQTAWVSSRAKITFIDKEPPISSTFFACFTNGCMADYEATPELVDKRQQGRTGHVHLGVFKVGDATVQMELVD
jgi:hypothetical protein